MHNRARRTERFFSPDFIIMGRERIFRFKQFAVHHGESAMKVGTDAVSLGAWAPCTGRVLDVGCGCGIIGLMAAQRGAERVAMIDIDAPSVAEATENVANSPWGEKVTVQRLNFLDLENQNFDNILSNPPFFASGILAPDLRRAAARHEGDLTPEAFMRKASEVLSPNGNVSIIIPPDRLETWSFAAQLAELYPDRICSLLTKVETTPRRIMVTFTRRQAAPTMEELSINSSQYKTITEEFYL